MFWRKIICRNKVSWLVMMAFPFSGIVSLFGDGKKEKIEKKQVAKKNKKDSSVQQLLQKVGSLAQKNAKDENFSYQSELVKLNDAFVKKVFPKNRFPKGIDLRSGAMIFTALSNFYAFCFYLGLAEKYEELSQQTKSVPTLKQAEWELWDENDAEKLATIPKSFKKAPMPHLSGVAKCLVKMQELYNQECAADKARADVSSVVEQGDTSLLANFSTAIFANPKVEARAVYAQDFASKLTLETLNSIVRHAAPYVSGVIKPKSKRNTSKS